MRPIMTLKILCLCLNFDTPKLTYFLYHLVISCNLVIETDRFNTTTHIKLYCSIELGPVVFDNTS